MQLQLSASQIHAQLGWHSCSGPKITSKQTERNTSHASEREDFRRPRNFTSGSLAPPHGALSQSQLKARIGCGHPPQAAARRATSRSQVQSASISSSSVTADVASTMAQADSGIRVLKVRPVPLSREAFAPFGQVVEPAEDGDEFGEKDADLDLSQGKPRVYIMRLKDRKLGFDSITHHASVTQCLGAVGGSPWYLGVCRPSIVGSDGDAPPNAATSKAGHRYLPPKPEDVVVFKIEGATIVKLHAGTWHAGPLFTPKQMDFFNLELNDTNVVDHTTHVFSSHDGVAFEFDED